MVFDRLTYVSLEVWSVFLEWKPAHR